MKYVTNASREILVWHTDWGRQASISTEVTGMYSSMGSEDAYEDTFKQAVPWHPDATIFSHEHLVDDEEAAMIRLEILTKCALAGDQP